MTIEKDPTNLINNNDSDIQNDVPRETIPVDPVRSALIEMADPNRLKKQVLSKLDEIKKNVLEGSNIEDIAWDAVIEISDLYADVLAFRAEEKKAAEAAKEAREKAKIEAEQAAKSKK